MAGAARIVLRCSPGAAGRVAPLVEAWLRGGVRFVAVAGHDCERIEDLIDEIVVGDGSGPDRFLLTSAHPGEAIEDVVRFAEALGAEWGGPVAVVDL